MTSVMVLIVVELREPPTEDTQTVVLPEGCVGGVLCCP